MEDKVSHDKTRDKVSEILATGRLLRRRMGYLAASIATTEDEMADTLERMARDRPADSGRLRARAAQARSFAALERDRAADYEHADSDPEAASSQSEPRCPPGRQPP